MKKVLLMFMIGFFAFSSNVKADTIVATTYDYRNEIELNRSVLNKIYQKIESSDYKYFAIILEPNRSNFSELYYFTLFLTNSEEYKDSLEISDSSFISKIVHYGPSIQCNYFVNTEDPDCYNFSDGFSSFMIYSPFNVDGWYAFYDSNFPYRTDSTPIEIKGIYEDNIVLEPNSIYPKLKDLYNYNSWAEYESSNNPKYTEVNLSNYDYVILNLKDYSKKDPFEINFQVKGMVGITPVYNYGTTEKDTITDRCNLSYSDYTDYRLFVIKEDSEKNVVYYVKACSDSSYIRYDNSIFDITYVDESNRDDPVIKINGTDYHTIPFDKLHNSANKNEENNFIPGASEQFTLSSIVKNLANNLNSIWGVFLTFMDFVTKVFGSLPVEFRTISITTFTVGCVLGLIKIIKS